MMETVKHFSSFESFVADYKSYLSSAHTDMSEKLSEEDCAKFRLMLACLALKWLDQAGDVKTLAQLRDQISQALNGAQALH